MAVVRGQVICVTPMDKVAALAGIVSAIAAAKIRIRMGAYGFTDPAITAALIERFKAGVDVKILMDHTQAFGPTQKVQVELLLSAGFKIGVDLIIGTSPDHGQILHWKNLMIDGEVVEWGSLNYGVTAFEQVNTVVITQDTEICALFENDWNIVCADVIKRCPQFNNPAIWLSAPCSTPSSTTPPTRGALG